MIEGLLSYLEIVRRQQYGNVCFSALGRMKKVVCPLDYKTR